MSMLDAIKNVLTALAADTDYPMTGGVYYGMCNAKSLPEWNYFVFNRRNVTSENNHRCTDRYEIHIIHEDYVMEEYEITVIKALKKEIPGISLAGDMTFDYVTKGDTQRVVEIVTIPMKKAKKVDDV